MADEQEVIEVLKNIKDPELNIDIYTLGLIRGINVEDKRIVITMTLTSQACPYGPQIIRDVETMVSRKTNKAVFVDVTFNPPWEPSPELREELMSGH